MVIPGSYMAPPSRRSPIVPSVDLAWQREAVSVESPLPGHQGQVRLVHARATVRWEHVNVSRGLPVPQQTESGWRWRDTVGQGRRVTLSQAPPRPGTVQ